MDQKTVTEEKPPLEIERIKKVYNDLFNEITHPVPCCCESCIYHLYLERTKGKHNRFDKVSFFLDFLAAEIKRSEIPHEVFSLFDKEDIKSPHLKKLFSRYDARFPDIYFYSLDPPPKIRNIERKVSKFIKKYLPDCGLNTNPQTIKSKLWRFRKIAGYISRLQQERYQKWKKSQPEDFERAEAIKKYNEDMRFLFKVVTTIYKEKEITQRDLQRQVRCKIEDLRNIWDLLEIKGVEIQPGKTIIYRWPSKSKKEKMPQ
jgi:hypothetical protein